MTDPPTFGYARAPDGVYLGYRIDGTGPIDLVHQSDWPGNIDMDRQDPIIGAWLREMGSFARVITHDIGESGSRAGTSPSRRLRPVCQISLPS